MNVKLNGENVELERAYSMNELIDKYDMKRETVVVEINGDLPDKSKYDELKTAEGDVIELIRFVGGG
jgi:sulfur carrier protein